jgi:hypothetical protein
MYKCLCVITLFLFLSCSSEKPPQLSRPSVPSGSGLYSLQISPINALRNSTLYLIAQGFKLSDARIEWLVNDRITSSPLISQFNAAETKKRDKIQARAFIKGKEILSNIIQIKNSLPVISKVRILPEVFKPGDTLSVEVSGEDIDMDKVTISYEWTKNGEPAGNNKQIEAKLKRGDKVDVKITPFDGEAYGRPVILHREIVNLPPIIIGDKEFSFDGKIYTCQIKATDTDGDLLSYALKSAPSGMTIDSNGLIRWNVPPDFAGRTPITVSISDGHGGEATQSFTLDIKSEKK